MRRSCTFFFYSGLISRVKRAEHGSSLIFFFRKEGDREGR